jgi:hypothetical protein
MASRQLLITRIAAAGTSLSPYRAKHGTVARLPAPTPCEVEVDADGLASCEHTPLRGRRH